MQGNVMARYDVVVYRRVIQFTEVVVDADSEDEAKTRAEAAAKGLSAERWQVEAELDHGKYEFNLSVM